MGQKETPHIRAARMRHATSSVNLNDLEVVGCFEFACRPRLHKHLEKRRGVRVPLTAVSPFSKPSYVSHTIGDHASLQVMIEKRFMSSGTNDRAPD